MLGFHTRTHAQTPVLYSHRQAHLKSSAHHEHPLGSSVRWYTLGPEPSAIRRPWLAAVPTPAPSGYLWPTPVRSAPGMLSNSPVNDKRKRSLNTQSYQSWNIFQLLQVTCVGIAHTSSPKSLPEIQMGGISTITRQNQLKQSHKEKSLLTMYPD